MKFLFLRIPMVSKDSDFPVIIQRLQFPVIPAYYLRFNRAQGQSLDQCGMLLTVSVFTHGQLYVGFSRCGDPDHVFVYADQTEFEAYLDKLPPNGTFTRNVVYKEIFR